MRGWSSLLSGVLTLQTVGVVSLSSGSAPVNSDLLQTDAAVVQSQMTDGEVSVPGSETHMSDDAGVSPVTKDLVESSTKPDTMECPVTVASAEMSGDVSLVETMDSAAKDCDVETSGGDLSTRLAELESVVALQQCQLTAMNAEKLITQQELSTTRADLQSKDDECRQVRDTLTELERQLAVQTRLLDEATDREDDMQRAVEASQAELRQSECRWHEVVDKKERLVMELRADLDALTGSVQRREHMWDNARVSMEQEMESLRLSVAQKTANHDSQVQVRPRSADYVSLLICYCLYFS